MQYLLKYFDEIIGKNLGPEVYAELLFFFSINLTPLALPLAVLISSLMTFGNLGEHFELTAIKASGISLTRTLLPLFVIAAGLSVLAFYNNDRLVPKANLKAYSLLYDIRQTKPALSLQEGSFYGGIPNYSIKVNQRFDDDVSLKGVIIYDHSKGRGNTDLILADSGRMFTFDNERYLMLEMFNGRSYNQPVEKSNYTYNKEPGKYVRNDFYRSKIVFNLESFGMQPTPVDYFKGNRVMKNISELSADIDSMENKRVEVLRTVYKNTATHNAYAHFSRVEVPQELEEAYQRIDSIDRAQAELEELEELATDTTIEEELVAEPVIAAVDSPKVILPKKSPKLLGPKNMRALEEDGRRPASNERISPPAELKITGQEQVLKEKEGFVAPTEVDTAAINAVERYFAEDPRELTEVYRSAVGQVRYIKNNYEVYGGRAAELQRNAYMWEIEYHKKWAQAAACLVMFLIGAPLGAIIKRGGLGVPVLISIIFFIIYYVLTMFGDKWAREGIVSPELGMWSANIILVPFGLLFLWQARNDARLFEGDFYQMAIAKLRYAIGEKVIRPELLRRPFKRHKRQK
jgi:lipopolysaccharide export system permease protein